MLNSILGPKHFRECPSRNVRLCLFCWQLQHSNFSHVKTRDSLTELEENGNAFLLLTPCFLFSPSHLSQFDEKLLLNPYICLYMESFQFSVFCLHMKMFELAIVYSRVAVFPFFIGRFLPLYQAHINCKPNCQNRKQRKSSFINDVSKRGSL